MKYKIYCFSKSTIEKTETPDVSVSQLKHILYDHNTGINGLALRKDSIPFLLQNIKIPITQHPSSIVHFHPVLDKENRLVVGNPLPKLTKNHLTDIGVLFNIDERFSADQWIEYNTSIGSVGSDVLIALTFSSILEVLFYKGNLYITRTVSHNKNTIDKDYKLPIEFAMVSE